MNSGEISDEDSGDDQMNLVVFEFNIDAPAQHPVYTGHFPGNPIVPGALLMQWIVLAIEENVKGYRFVGVKSFKFIAPVTPGLKLSLTFSMKIASGINNPFSSKLLCVGGEQIICKGTLLMSQVEN